MRILVVDDEKAIHDAYRHILSPDARSRDDLLDDLAGALFEDFEAASSEDAPADITFCSQGLEAVAAVETAIAEDRPFQVAFIDVRMPPGIDGKETARRIRLLDSRINIVIVSAYTDHNVTDIALAAGPADKIFYISKPFAAAEIQQMATALSRRWEADAQYVRLLKEKIDELAESEARARHAAHHDFLTGAPNRLAFQHALQERLAGGQRQVALALLDLDRFKRVNDTFGHGAGDHLLQTVYEDIRGEVAPGTVVARLGGDEFALLIHTPTIEAAEEVCERIVRRCSQTYVVFNNSVQIGASIGLLWAEDFPDRKVGDLLRFADIALFEAKRGGRDRCCRFDAKMDASTQFRQTIEAALRPALLNGELSLHYQPIVERNSLTPVGFEALLRWHSPTHGEVPPAVFIPIAEESGLIHRIGEWVVQRAMEDSLNWPNFFVSVNFSPRQFKRPDLVPMLGDMAKRTGVPCERVQIEITETVMFEDMEHAARTLSELQRIGFRIALDDFGTGYSNLLNVKNFALDCIKIDKSFIDGLGFEPRAAAIVGSITQLARGLGLNIVAEGVETDLQCQALRVIGCSHMQGYLFGAAAPLAESNARYEEAQATQDSSADHSEPSRRVVR